MLKINTIKENGFTLIEIAVVLVLVGLLLGSFISSLTSRIETTRRNNTTKQLEDIKSALLGFASAQGRLPCPTRASGLGLEQPVGGAGGCTNQHGFIPGRTLAINGNYNRDTLLTDSWGNPIRYSVSTDVGSAFTNPVGLGGIQGIGMANLEASNVLDLVICNQFSANPATCTAGVNTLIDSATFIVLSLGKDGSFFAGAGAIAPNSNQGENSAEVLVAANAAGENIAYAVATDTVFVKSSYSSVGSVAGQFDDIIIWASPFVLYSRMTEAGQLP